jgi:hypothetical protein
VYNRFERVAEMLDFVLLLDFSARVRFPSPAPISIWSNEINGFVSFQTSKKVPALKPNAKKSTHFNSVCRWR